MSSIIPLSSWVKPLTLTTLGVPTAVPIPGASFDCFGSDYTWGWALTNAGQQADTTTVISGGDGVSVAITLTAAAAGRATLHLALTSGVSYEFKAYSYSSGGQSWTTHPWMRLLKDRNGTTTVISSAPYSTLTGAWKEQVVSALAVQCEYDLWFMAQGSGNTYQVDSLSIKRLTEWRP